MHFYRADVNRLDEFPTYLYIGFNYYLGGNMAIVICTLFVARKALTNDENSLNFLKPNTDWNSITLFFGIKVTIHPDNHGSNETQQVSDTWAFVRRPNQNQLHKHDQELIEIQSISNEDLENHI